MVKVPITTYKTAKPRFPRVARFTRIFQKRRYQRIYLFASLAILLLTTLLWSFLSARIHQNNADQLVNSFLYDGTGSFKNATLPGQHTYLLKWPLFFLIHLFNTTDNAYIWVTVALSVLTVSLFALVLYWIEKRPLVYGTLLLAVASTLLLIPAQPYAGGLLPVNMAMIATRNLEYILYISSLMYVISAPRIKNPKFFAAVFGLSILIATDKLFMSLSLGGAFFAFFSYALAKKWNLVTQTIRWFVASIGGVIGSAIILTSLSFLKITHFSSQATNTYGLIKSVHQGVLGSAYALIGVLTNFGANPSYDTTLIKAMPARAIHHLVSLSGPALVINGVVLVILLLTVYNTLLISFGNKRRQNIKADGFYSLSIMMIWTSIAAVGAFVVSDHYYAADARYLSIIFFAFFICAATYLRNKRWATEQAAIAGFILVGVIILSIPNVISYSKTEQSATLALNHRNELIVLALKSHPVDTLVGDYWRVIPTKQLSRSTISVLPLSGCIDARKVLTTKNWQPDLRNNSFAYILSLDKSQTDFPQCSLEAVTAAYGKPNASLLIDGTLDNPKELLMFYDHGAYKSAPNKGTISQLSATITPIRIDELPNTVCVGPTILNVVAHEDDDLLFINPDTQNDINVGHCIRTVYITAGDAGSQEYYWLGREQGSEAAYSKMLGTDNIWIQRIVKLGDNQFVTVSNPKGNNKISLIFVRLPDGNLHGEGFNASQHESISKLLDGKIPNIRAVYGNSSFSSSNLISALTDIMRTYQPAEIRTLSTFTGPNAPDHSDHMAVSNLTQIAHAQYEKSQYNNTVAIPIKHYIGYPIHINPENVTGLDLDNKVAAFLTYANHDGAVCHSLEECDAHTNYGSYLHRQYIAE